MGCSICLDDDDEIVFFCSTPKCEYEMCAACIKRAFEDFTGSNARDCPLCHKPAARDMVESLCGRGAVQEIERQLRPKVEFEVQKNAKKREDDKKEMNEMKSIALKHYRDLVEDLNMRCPRCKMVFDDYDGCNALTCWNDRCKAAICAICLKDCGGDSHSHVLSQHGDLFNKDLFHKAKKERELATLDRFIKQLDEPYEVKAMVKIEYEKSNAGITASRTAGLLGYIHSAKANLRTAIRSDRLSVLGNSDRYNTGRNHFGLTSEDVSPRSAVPDNYKLVLCSQESSICCINLYRRSNMGWTPIPLPGSEDNTDEKEQNERIVDALINTRRSFQCGVVAFQGERQLYQTRNAPVKGEGRELQSDCVSITFRAVNKNGDLVGPDLTLSQIGCDGRDIVGINQNLRLVLLDNHINGDEEAEVFDALRQYVCGGTAQRVFHDIQVPAPQTFAALNERQKRVAHPLSLPTAMEVAGPPGTGKTRTITELVRGILCCTDSDIIVLSERNGAIDAIAEKIAGDCVHQSNHSNQTNRRKTVRVTDVELWTAVAAFGSAGSIGPSTQLFTQSEKLR